MARFLSNDPGRVESSAHLILLCGNVLSPHRNVPIFTQRMRIS